MDASPFVARMPGPTGARPGVDQFGQLAPLLADPAVTDIFVNGSRGVWVDRGSGGVRDGPVLSEPDARALAVRLIALGGRHIDESKP